MKILPAEISDIGLRLNWRSHQHSTQHGRFSIEHHRSPIQSLPRTKDLFSLHPISRTL